MRPSSPSRAWPCRAQTQPAVLTRTGGCRSIPQRFSWVMSLSLSAPDATATGSFLMQVFVCSLCLCHVSSAISPPRARYSLDGIMLRMSHKATCATWWWCDCYSSRFSTSPYASDMPFAVWQDGESEEKTRRWGGRRVEVTMRRRTLTSPRHREGREDGNARACVYFSGRANAKPNKKQPCRLGRRRHVAEW